MRSSRPRTTPPRGLLALVVAMVVLPLSALGGTAWAEPTASPSVSASASAPVAPTPSAPAATPAAGPGPTSTPASTATPTSTATPGPTASPTPGPTVTERPATPATSGARAAGRPVTPADLLARLPARAQRLSERSGDGRTARRGTEDDRFLSLAVANCASDTGAGDLEVVLGLLVDQPLTLRYVVTDDADTRITGTVTLDPGEFITDLTVPDLGRGRYHLDLYDADATTPVSSEPFQIVRCITVSVSCQAITFTNPADNPAVVVGFGAVDEDLESASFPLAPGRSARARTSLSEVAWLAAVDTGDDSLLAPLSLAGFEEESVPQDCEVEFATSAFISCGRGSATFDANFGGAGDLSTHTARFEIYDEDNRLVAEGDIPGSFVATLPGVGDYRYVVYLDGSADSFENANFSVLRCLGVTATCRAVSFSNPRQNPAVVISYDRGDRDSLGQQRDVRSGRTAKISWREPSMVYVASGVKAEPALTELASAIEFTEVSVAQDCSSGGSGGTGSGSAGSGLADTGSSTTLGAGVAAGLLLTMAGGVVLGRRRRQR